MTLQREQSPDDHDFYIMELDSGIYVDGREKGNLSRFINHSCDPNCELSVGPFLSSSSLSAEVAGQGAVSDRHLCSARHRLRRAAVI
jgi:hypothetical protein